MMKFAISSILLLFTAQIQGSRLLQQNNCRPAPCLIPPCPIICDCVGCDTCPTGAYNDGCNDCTCNKDGTAFCTKKACLVQGEPFCKPDCSTILCANPVCNADETKIVPAGSCCPICKENQDCRLVRCGAPNCGPDEIAITRPGECCQVCVPGVCPIEPEPSTCVGCDTCGKNGYNDGCNDCFCDANGNVGCTKKFCLTPGQPFCKPDCSTILCLNPVCKDGEIKITPAGECCPVCVPENPICIAIPCPLLQCGPDEIPFQKPGACCPECVPGLCPNEPPCVGCDSCPNGYNDGCNDCTCNKDGTVACTEKACLVQGEPFCKPDCSAVSCLNPVCEKGQIKITPAGQCCPICVTDPDCSVVRCAQPVCGDGEVAVIKQGECCETCVPAVCPSEPEPECVGCDTCPTGSYNDGCNDCTCSENGLTLCTKRACLVQGEPFCKPDCSAVSCLNPVCGENEEKITPAGGCCPVCVRKPGTFVCPAFCPNPNCGENEVAVTKPGECCPECVPGVCPSTQPECPIEGQVFNACGSACTATCDNPNPICTLQCVPRCQCQGETPILNRDGTKCIAQSECRKQCRRNRECSRGYKCEPDPSCKGDIVDRMNCASEEYCLRTIPGPKGRCKTANQCPDGFVCAGGRCTDYE